MEQNRPSTSYLLAIVIVVIAAMLYSLNLSESKPKPTYAPIPLAGQQPPGLSRGVADTLYEPQLGSQPTQLPIPSAFTGVPLPSGFGVFRSPTGRVWTNYTFDQYMNGVTHANSGGNLRYASSSTGSDANNGQSIANARKSIGAFISNAQNTNAAVLLRPGDIFYNADGWNNANAGTGDKVIGPWNGWANPTDRTPRWSSGKPGIGANLATDRNRISAQINPANITWTLDTGTTYRFTIGSETPVYAIDEAVPNVYGVGLYLTQAASIAACRTTLNSYISNSGVFYLNVGRAPDSRIKVFTTQIVARHTAASGKIVFYNIDFEGRVSIAPTVGGTAEIAFYNCTFKYAQSGQNVLTLGNDVDVYFWNCDVRGARGTADNIDYGDGAIGREFHIYSVDAGTVGDTNNASTCHENSSVIRIGGHYGFTLGRILHDVGTGQSLNIGNYTEFSRTTGSAGAHYGAGALNTDTVDMWVTDARFGPGGTTSFYILQNSEVFIRNITNPNALPVSTVTAGRPHFF
jgi:hypothetical protein